MVIAPWMTRNATAARGSRRRAGALRDDAMTRSEEVRFGTRTGERARVRLRKHVVTDYVEKRVPVKREAIRVEHGPPAS